MGLSALNDEKTAAETAAETAVEQPALPDLGEESGSNCNPDDGTHRCRALLLTAERDQLLNDAEYQRTTAKAAIETAAQALMDAEVARHEGELQTLRTKFRSVMNLCQRQGWQTHAAT